MSIVLAEERVRPYLRTGIAIDSNLLVLLLIGKYQPSYIPKFKPTASFLSDDLEIVSHFVAQFRSVVISPHVLAETSNHSFKMPEGNLKQYLDVFVGLVGTFKETIVSKDAILSHRYFKKLGVTDVGLILCCLEGKFLLLTIDRKLANMATECGVEAVHLNELRSYNWLA